MTVLAAGWWAQHGAHTLSLLGPALLITLLALGSEARAWMHKRRLGQMASEARAGVASERD